ncbi:hypothetical protein G3A39_38375 [Paraburkholderia aspalathi]|nr:hypothetical protein [Paraburkholderia aspalathi]
MTSETPEWEVYHDITNNTCYILRKDAVDNSFVLSSYYNKSFTVTFFNRKLHSLQSKNNYTVYLIAGNERIKGFMKFYKMNDSGFLKFYQPTKLFYKALESNDVINLEIDGEVYGPFDVKNAKQAYSGLTNCRDSKLVYKYIAEFSTDSIVNPFKENVNLHTKIDNNVVNVPKGVIQTWTLKDAGKKFQFLGYSVLLSRRDKPDGTSALVVDVTEVGFQSVSFELLIQEGMIGKMKLTNFNGSKEASSIVFTNVTKRGNEIRVVINNSLIDLGVVSNSDGMPVKFDKLMGDVFVLPDERAIDFKTSNDNTMPIRIYDIVENKMKDVSGDAQFRSYYNELFGKYSDQCWIKVNNDVAACTGLFAVSARLGLFDATIEAFKNAYFYPKIKDSKFSYCGLDGCKNYKSYIEAIVDLFDKWGYVDKINLDEQKRSATALKPLLNNLYTNTGEYAEGCDEFYIGLSKTKGNRGATVYSLSSEEHHCLFSNTVMIGTAVHAGAICYVDDSNPYISEVLVGQNRGKMTLGSIVSGRMPDLSIEQYAQCK